MRIVILGAAGFIGTNLALRLSKHDDYKIVLVDEKEEYFINYPSIRNSEIRQMKFDSETIFDNVLEEQDIVFHLLSTNNPTTSNEHIGTDIGDNISISINLLEACVRKSVKRVIFISSGGTVYGPDADCPIAETAETNPINTYGIQKLTIEKLLYLYGYMHELDYKIIRLSNPYGPYQRPNGKLGVVSTFIYKALHNEKITVYGDGSVIRDYIYIEDAVRGINLIAHSTTSDKIFNLGSGKGTSVNEVIDIIKNVLRLPIEVEYAEKRSVDVPKNILDISRYLNQIESEVVFKSLEDGMLETMRFFQVS